MKNYVISIGREFGSGGRRVGKLLAEALGIPCYDRHLIEEAAEQSGFSQGELEDVDEAKANRFLYRIPSRANPYTGYGKPMNDTLFVIQSQLIRQYADRGSCVIVGRCSDKVLEDREGLISVFIYAPYEERIREISRRYETDEKEAAYLVKQADKIRGRYYRHYAKKEWGARNSYNLMIDSSHFSEKEMVAMIRGMIRERTEEEKI